MTLVRQVRQQVTQVRQSQTADTQQVSQDLDAQVMNKALAEVSQGQMRQHKMLMAVVDEFLSS